MTQNPTVTISHSIPGRLRVHLSLAPQNVARFIESIEGHAGLDSVEYTAVTRSVLARFDPREIRREEIVTRIALALSLSMGDVPVTVLKEPGSEVLTNGAALAGMLTGSALLLQWLNGDARTASLGKAAALGTGAAVLQHGWREIRERGYFDPEVLSLTYLVAAVLRGDHVRGALITWMLAFGRHLLAAAPEGVELRPTQRKTDGDGPAQYELVVVPGVSQQAPLFTVLQSFLRYFSTAGAAGQTGLINELRAVSTAHGQVLEGLGWMRDDIPMHFR